MYLTPKTSAWAWLLLPTSFPIGLGIANLYESSVIMGALCILFGVLIVLFNATVRVEVRNKCLYLRRYGIIIRSVAVRGASLSEGLGGELPLLPAIVIFGSDGRKVALIKSYFTKQQLESLVSYLVSNGSVSQL